MRRLVTLGVTLTFVINPAIAAPKVQALPRVVGGSELRQLIRGATIGEIPFENDQLNELFRRDGSYQQTDGMSEGDVGTYHFSGNRFCITVRHQKLDLCRSVLIDRDKRTWLLHEGDQMRLVRVGISHF